LTSFQANSANSSEHGANKFSHLSYMIDPFEVCNTFKLPFFRVRVDTFSWSASFAFLHSYDA